MHEALNDDHHLPIQANLDLSMLKPRTLFSLQVTSMLPTGYMTRCSKPIQFILPKLSDLCHNPKKTVLC